MPSSSAAWAADAVVILPIGFVLFVLLLGCSRFDGRGSRGLRLPAALWGVLIEYGGWVCPLTPV